MHPLAWATHSWERAMHPWARAMRPLMRALHPLTWVMHPWARAMRAEHRRGVLGRAAPLCPGFDPRGAPHRDRGALPAGPIGPGAV